jgi:hypothetical protein
LRIRENAGAKLEHDAHGKRGSACRSRGTPSSAERLPAGE